MRGLAAQKLEMEGHEGSLLEAERADSSGSNPYKVYDLPFQHILDRYSCLSRIPIFPQYKELRLPTVNCPRKRNKQNTCTSV